MKSRPLSLLLLGLFTVPVAAQEDILDWVEHAYAENDGVRLHYAAMGEGPLVVMLHGFPDYWYTWRHQMGVLAEDFRVVAPDLRGYNKSDKPKGVAAYAMPRLIADVAAVIRAEGREKAIVVGHDWGAAIAWQVAMNLPQRVERLVILSVPHPSGFGRELSTNEDQRQNSQYARDFQKEDAHLKLTAEGLSTWVNGKARARYVEAFQRSDIEAMLHYYKANYPRSSGGGENAASIAPASAPSFPKIRCSVLVIHGMQDQALNHRGHAYTWEWVDADTTLVMLPKAGHFVQHDESDTVTKTIHDWLLR